MDREVWFRRAIHLSFPVFLLYYVAPTKEWFGVDREVVLIAVFVGFLIFEIVRRSRGFRLYGMRDYEVRGIPAYIWAGAGLTFSFLFFHPIAVVPAVIGTAVVDPLCGFLRERSSPLYPGLPWSVWALVTLDAVSQLTTWGYLDTLLVSFAAASIAIAVEWPLLKNVDDDFLMLIFPGLFVTGAVALLGGVVAPMP